ncbi:DUF1501 domain-containing protein [Luteolibacter marinus]|uniref:DUF1501 domain-containing protein n=1 Tax=Luteolibacter marinus TaxID=2776705 RepID=UPI001869473A|nr:DUF1501 domain-containing protein [Luteolibacter marinus]
MPSRRQFLGEASCAAIGSTSVLSTLLNLTMANHAAAQGGFGSQRKSLVCLFLSGGCDTFNFLIPTEPGPYAEYAAARSNLAIPLNDPNPSNNIIPLTGTGYGLHPSCVHLAEMFNGTGSFTGKKRLALLANVGTLIEPIASKQDYLSGNIALPKALFSHRDQIEQWQTSVPQGMQVLSGWGGRAADVIHSTFNTEQTGNYYMPMNFSLAGNSAFQIGRSEGQFVITGNGALTFDGSTGNSAVNQAKTQVTQDTVASPIEEHYRNLFQRTHGRITANSIERGAEFQQHFDNPGTLNSQNVDAVIAAAPFPAHWISDQFRAAVKTIAIREQLKLARQTIFIEFGGWDHHAELLTNQRNMLGALDGALHAFQICLENLGLSDDVITFTCSDFGRTLRSNGQGTDHAWSGNQLVLGGPVQGGVIRGSFPSLVIDGPDDIGRGGRIFPKLSADEYFCELLRWFGVTAGDMDMVLPNIRNFYDPASSSHPVNFLA